ncbi:uncharacterized protein LOC126810667 [Patella vulgata]|uniref:uncharacterized protein LOC126810667 n=1 Tax=Patella vulgata TaxID=6465 RepID=UPI0024A95244|nr:uncharacterized protein LOC126810667 [Patella vulgata]
MCIAENLEQNLKDELNSAKFFSILTDGSTDSATQEKELLYVIFLGADGASVNMGVNRGLAVQLREDIPWLISVHCFNHRLELAIRDGFKGTHWSIVKKL